SRHFPSGRILPSFTKEGTSPSCDVRQYASRGGESPACNLPTDPPRGAKPSALACRVSDAFFQDLRGGLADVNAPPIICRHSLHAGSVVLVGIGLYEGDKRSNFAVLCTAHS